MILIIYAFCPPVLILLSLRFTRSVILIECIMSARAFHP